MWFAPNREGNASAEASIQVKAWGQISAGASERPAKQVACCPEFSSSQMPSSGK